MKFKILLLAVILLLVLGDRVMAMSSANYRLDWFTPMTTGAGGSVSSSNYAVDFVAGEAASGILSNPETRVCLGFPCFEYRGEIPWAYKIYLPLSVREFR
jgi:hypothetical protein